MLKKINKQCWLFSMGIAAATGVASSALSGAGYTLYHLMIHPAGAPPWWLIVCVWTVLYALLGSAAYLIFDTRLSVRTPIFTRFPPRNNGRGQRETALLLYGAQLGMNFLWGLFFFGFYWYFFALLWLAAQIILAALTAKQFLRINPLAGILLAPYLLWLLYMAYLNYGFWLLNARF